MMRGIFLTAAIFVVLGAGPAGCSDDDNGPGPSDAAVDAAVDAEIVDGGGTDSLEILVTEFVGDATQPLEGAVVALDDRYGDRIELTSGSDGRVSFQNFHWGDGEISLSVYKEGYILWSGVGYTQTDVADIIQDMGGDVLWVGLSPEDPAAGIFLYGTAQNMVSTANNLLVTSFDSQNSHEAAGADWAVEVPSGTAHTLVALEYEWVGFAPSGRGIQMNPQGWIVRDVADATQDTEVVLDFADGVDATDIHTTTGSFPVPARAESLLRTDGIPQIRVTDEDSGLSVLLGLPSDTDLSTDGNSYEYDAFWIQPARATSPVTQYLIRDRLWFWYSFTIQDGWPGQGAQNIEFLDLPTLISPPTSGTPLERSEPFQWQLHDSDVFVTLIVQKTDRDIWYLGLWKDTTTGTFPEPPSNVDLATYLGASPLTVLMVVGRSQPGQAYFQQAAVTRFRLMP